MYADEAPEAPGDTPLTPLRQLQSQPVLFESARATIARQQQQFATQVRTPCVLRAACCARRRGVARGGKTPAVAHEYQQNHEANAQVADLHRLLSTQHALTAAAAAAVDGDVAAVRPAALAAPPSCQSVASFPSPLPGSRRRLWAARLAAAASGPRHGPAQTGRRATRAVCRQKRRR